MVYIICGFKFFVANFNSNSNSNSKKFNSNSNSKKFNSNSIPIQLFFQTSNSNSNSNSNSGIGIGIAHQFPSIPILPNVAMTRICTRLVIDLSYFISVGNTCTQFTVRGINNRRYQHIPYRGQTQNRPQHNNHNNKHTRTANKQNNKKMEKGINARLGKLQ